MVLEPEGKSLVIVSGSAERLTLGHGDAKMLLHVRMVSSAFQRLPPMVVINVAVGSFLDLAD